MPTRTSATALQQSQATRRQVDLDENLVSLAEAAALLPRIAGKRIAISTLFRWCSRGLRCVRLEHLRIGRRIFTTRAALQQFFLALAELDDRDETQHRIKSSSPKRRPPTSPQRRRAIAEAEAVLKEAGI